VDVPIHQSFSNVVVFKANEVVLLNRWKKKLKGNGTGLGMVVHTLGRLWFEARMGNKLARLYLNQQTGCGAVCL
jgi:hypothetical protein